MSSKITRVVLLMAVSMVMVSGCKTVGIQVPRLVPARKANLGVFKTVAVQEFDGRAEGSAGVASEMSDSVRQSLSTYERLKVLDRSRLGEVLNELKLGASDLTDGSNVSKLGKIITAGALVAGKITTYMYNEENTRKETTCSRSVKVGKKWRTERYRCTVFERTGKAVVRASIDVIDVTTGATVVTDSLNAERSAYETATDQDPAPIDGHALLADARREIVEEFVKDVLPHTVQVEVYFRKDGDIPALEHGIKYAMVGDWTEAVSTFRQALKGSLANPKLSPKVIAYAHADLGLALACQGGKDEMNEALKLLNKAFQLSGDEDYLNDKTMVQGWIAQQRKLEQQTAGEEKAE